MENRLATLEQQRALQDAADNTQREEWEERVHSAQHGEDSARRELQGLRSDFYWAPKSTQLEINKTTCGYRYHVVLA